MSIDHQEYSSWWGQYNIGINQTALWQIGPLRLAIQRHRNEWWIGHEPIPDVDPDITTWEYQSVAPDVDISQFTNITRHVSESKTESVWLRPLLADRAIVSRPLTPFYISPQASVEIFVRSPLWLRIELGNDLTPILEMPMLRPSDTWFGPNTTTGELCYASMTSTRNHVENLPVGPHHAVSQVVIQNQANNQLHVERFVLPAPSLAVFGTSDGLLWTQNVTMSRSESSDLADFKIDSGPPDFAAATELVSEARQSKSILSSIYAFGALFSG